MEREQFFKGLRSDDMQMDVINTLALRAIRALKQGDPELRLSPEELYELRKLRIVELPDRFSVNEIWDAALIEAAKSEGFTLVPGKVLRLKVVNRQEKYKNSRYPEKRKA